MAAMTFSRLALLQFWPKLLLDGKVTSKVAAIERVAIFGVHVTMPVHI